MTGPLCVSLPGNLRKLLRTARLRVAGPALSILLLASTPALAELRFETGAALKLGSSLIAQPANNLYRHSTGAHRIDHTGSFRYSVLARTTTRWSFELDYLIDWTRGESRSVYRPADGGASATWLDLDSTLSATPERLLVHSLDRLSANYFSDNLVLKLGRQVISWGNGIFFTPLDFFNPFPPDAVDREYKRGADMLYFQYLFASGNDLQLIWTNRDAGSEAVTPDSTMALPDHGESAHSSTALKFHWFVESGDTPSSSMQEFDLTVGRHLGDALAALGYTRAIGSGLWRSELLGSQTRDGPAVALVTNITTSLEWSARPMTVLAEYAYHSMGMPRGEYDADSLASNPALFSRLSRGEIHTLGRHHLALSVTAEMHPLWRFSSTLLANLQDPSALWQLTSLHDLAENLRLGATLAIPLGADDSEYGGPEPAPGVSGANRWSAATRLAWYF